VAGKSVPSGSPSSKRTSTFGVLPDAMHADSPAAVVMRTACSLLLMPPVPRLLLLAPTCASVVSSMFDTRGIG